LWREKINPTENEETRERRATKRKLYTTPSSSVTIAGLIGEQHHQHQKHQMMMTMTRNRTTTTTKKKTMRFLLLAFLLCFCFATTFAFGEEPQSKQQQQPKLGLPNGEVIELNDSNFDKYVNKGTAEQLPVIIDVYATWCVHCKQLEPVWRELARELQSEVYVGKIDGEKERALANRLSANKGFPTIILLHQNKMRFYSGERSVEKLTHFCRKGWREVKPEPWHKTANNWFGQIFGLVHKVPGVLKGMYSQFSKDYSDTQILFMALSVPVVSGMLLIWVADAITVRRTVSRSRRYVAEQELIRRRAAQAAAHPHAE
jgi:thiol-disulfide isomerase/thioredoxin